TALQFAHRHRMVHRDIKPANILVQWHGASGEGTPGLVKVSDFGLARLHAPVAAHPTQDHPGTILVAGNAVMGTPDYLAPDQARTLPAADTRAALYGLGCPFPFLLTGQVPFPGGSAFDKLVRHATQPPRPLREFRPDVPPTVAAIVARLMAKK